MFDQQSIKPLAIIQWLDDASQKLSQDLNRLESISEARILLTHALKKPTSYLYTWPDKILDETVQFKADQYLERRKLGEPIAYILGCREFWSLEFKVTPNVLIPRQETELLVELCLDYFSSLSQQQTVRKLLELGTGSGAISIAVAHELPQLEITATDVSNLALDVASINAASHQCLNIEFMQCSWYEGITEKSYDMIVSNPPYIAESDEHLEKGDLPYEPKLALSSGEYGLKDIEHIISSSKTYLKTGGILALEHGYDQAQSIQQLMLDAGFVSVTTIKDHANIDRITTGLNEVLKSE